MNLLHKASNSAVDFTKVEIKKSVMYEVERGFFMLWDHLNMGEHYIFSDTGVYEESTGVITRHQGSMVHSVLFYFNVKSKESSITQTHFIVMDKNGYVSLGDDKCYGRFFDGMHHIRIVLHSAFVDGDDLTHKFVKNVKDRYMR